VWIHYMSFAARCAAAATAPAAGPEQLCSNAGHFIWDELLPLFRLPEMFGLDHLRRQPLRCGVHAQPPPEPRAEPGHAVAAQRAHVEPALGHVRLDMAEPAALAAELL
jgi:hypothetical protein